MKKKILVIDDEKDIAQVIEIALEAYYDVDVLHSISDPLVEIKLKNPDLILLDLWIPEVGGEQVLRELKKNSITKDIPVIVLSADNHAMEIARESRADGFLAKPFKIVQLRQLVHDTIMVAGTVHE